MIFTDRWDAARQLIPMLQQYAGEDGVVLAIPRGGVPIGVAIARSLGFPLDLLLIKKLGHPRNPELAIGAVSLTATHIDPEYAVDESYLQDRVAAVRQSLRERQTRFLRGREPLSVKDKVVIVVDDGIATGHTLMAGIQLLRQQSPARIVVAVPVSPRQTADAIRKLVDDFVCAYTPSAFSSVGQFYTDFSEITDAMVIQLLESFAGDDIPPEQQGADTPDTSFD